ncbi:M48 family metallopeptidase [Sphingomonas sp. PB2P19]|uniref:M48 family metallopeptidase n=1 Tax=Sphingomonas rhamnosi TaxID=3096156 RepID=UPI002FC9598B
MSMFVRLLPVLLLGAAPVPKEEVPPRAFFEALRTADLRLATIAYRLTTANAALCDRLQPELGMPIHALSQYGADSRANATAVFGFESVVGVEGVVAGGPAARAGIQGGDSIAAIDGRAQPSLAAMKGDGPADRDTAEALITGRSPRAPIALSLLRDGRGRDVSVTPIPGCRSRFEILLGSGLGASADGAIVQIGEGFFEGYDDAEIAVIVAHELAHNILRHRARLDAAKINRGLLAELGRNGRLIRETENDADRLGVYLLANAGYDPMAAPTFWREKGGDIDGGLFRSRTHASSKARAEVLEAVAREIAATPKRPIVPAILATRDVPLR